VCRISGKETWHFLNEYFIRNHRVFLPNLVHNETVKNSKLTLYDLVGNFLWRIEILGRYVKFASPLVEISNLLHSSRFNIQKYIVHSNYCNCEPWSCAQLSLDRRLCYHKTIGVLKSTSSKHAYFKKCWASNKKWRPKIWRFHGGDYAQWHLLGCYAVWLL
jgi:hypothetical protein